MSEKTEGTNHLGVMGELERARELVAKLRIRLQPGGDEDVLSGEVMEALSRAMAGLRAFQGAGAGCRVAGLKLEESDSHQLQHPPASSPTHSVGSEESSPYGRRPKAPEKKGGHRRRSHPCAAREVASGTLDDGHTWRKYGQKDIQNSKCPRSYYRCTHKYTRGCQAARQVQKREDDPCTFFITYFGDHTCSLTPNLPQQPLPPRSEIIYFSSESVLPTPAASSTLLHVRLPIRKKEIITPDSVKGEISQPTEGVGQGYHSQRDVVSKPSAPATPPPELCGAVGVEQGETSSGESSCMSDASYKELGYIEDPFIDLSCFFPVDQHDFNLSTVVELL